MSIRKDFIHADIREIVSRALMGLYTQPRNPSEPVLMLWEPKEIPGYALVQLDVHVVLTDKDGAPVYVRPWLAIAEDLFDPDRKGKVAATSGKLPRQGLKRLRERGRDALSHRRRSIRDVQRVVSVIVPRAIRSCAAARLVRRVA